MVSMERHCHKPTDRPATGQRGVTRDEAQSITWEGFLSRPKQEAQPLQSPMTMAELVGKLFIPEQ
jgi:hypothetical protein